MKPQILLLIALVALIGLAASYIYPWLADRRDASETAGTQDEWDGGDTTNWRG